jgi:hypothetical protein
MMKNLRIFLLSALLLGAGTAAFAQNARCLPARTDGVDPYKAGEKIVFNVSYNWHAVQTDVAKANLTADQTTLNGEKVWHTKMAMKTAPFFDVFFKIRETFESWFALKGVEPRRFHRDTREGDYTAINDYVYDRPAGKIHAVVNYRNQGEETLDIPYGNCTYDVTSLFYFVRQMDFGMLKSGQAFPVSIAIDREVLGLKLTYLGQENKYVRGIGTVAARKFGISLRKGEVFEGDQDAILWFSDDENHVPVAFMAPLKVGAMNGRLKSYTGLAHPFDALISTKKVK